MFAQPNNPPGLNLIRVEDLKKDLYELAAAHFNGRSALYVRLLIKRVKFSMQINGSFYFIILYVLYLLPQSL